MSALLITYDLNSPGQKHAKVLEKIKSFNGWAKLSESCYAVNTYLTASQLFNQLKPLIDTNDQIWIIPLKKPYAGYGSKKVIEWLDTNLTH